MQLWVLGSGSRGNAVLVDSGAGRVLVDAGFGLRTLAQRFAAIGVAPESVEACIVTHEHVDHVRGAAHAAQRWGWALHASVGTVRACPTLAAAATQTFNAGAVLHVAGCDVQTVATSHDAVESVAVVVQAQSGARAGICYDLGIVTDAVRDAMRELDLLVLEANHDGDMLRAGPYPPSVVDRIAGRRGHLSNRAASALAREIAAPGLRQIVLAHLSESCNDPRLAVTAVSDALARTRFRGTVTPASQDGVLGPFAAAPSRPTPRTVQLALF